MHSPRATGGALCGKPVLSNNSIDGRASRLDVCGVDVSSRIEVLVAAETHSTAGAARFSEFGAINYRLRL